MVFENFDKRLFITALLKRIESCPMDRETLELTFAKYEKVSKQLKAEEEAKSGWNRGHIEDIRRRKKNEQPA